MLFEYRFECFLPHGTLGYTAAIVTSCYECLGFVLRRLAAWTENNGTYSDEIRVRMLLEAAVKTICDFQFTL